MPDEIGFEITRGCAIYRVRIARGGGIAGVLVFVPFRRARDWVKAANSMPAF